MSPDDVFDAFYRSTRSDVHLQAFLLTGDLTAATAAVRDAYAVTWAQWKKVSSRHEDPTDFVRPLVWRLAQRRHTGRLWHRNKGLTDDDKLVLDAVHKLSAGHRRVLLLVDVAGVPLDAAGPELALTRQTTETKLGTARAELAASLGREYAERVLGLAQAAGLASLPRTSIVVRAGRERRRLVTVGSIAAAVALTVGVGAAAREPGQERASGVHQVLPGGDPVGEKLPKGVQLTTPEQLLQPFQLSGLAPDQVWSVERTDNNTTGDGINTICQQTRFADPRGIAALVRTYSTTSKPKRSALQSVEISKDVAAADEAFDTTVNWFAGCREARLQMVGAYRLTGVGERADVLQVRVAGTPAATYTVGIARVKSVTTTLVTKTVGTPPKIDAFATALSDAVAKLCPSDSDGCSGTPTVAAVPPPPSGEEQGFVATVDLPAVGTLRQPWVGVDPVDVLREGDVMASCDQANYRKAKATSARMRTFLIPEAQVGETFGLTETVGTFAKRPGAVRFLAGVRANVATCEEDDLTTDITAEFSEKKPGYDLSAWLFETKVSEDVTVAFRVGFVRVGAHVAKLTFVPDGKQDMTTEAFEALVRRAGQRLGEMTG